MHSINYTSGLLLALAGMAGYILLLCKKRVGFSVLLAGAVLMLGSQLLTSLTALLTRSFRVDSILTLLSDPLRALDWFPRSQPSSSRDVASPRRS